jgi:hypothetical protein
VILSILVSGRTMQCAKNGAPVKSIKPRSVNNGGSLRPSEYLFKTVTKRFFELLNP